jgi:hypothetical protein
VCRYLVLLPVVLLLACSSNDPEVQLPPTRISEDPQLLDMVDLDGRYIDSMLIAPEGLEDLSPGEEVTITFEATGLAQVRQFEIVVELSPLSAFAVDRSIFRPQRPFISPFASGIEFNEDGTLRLGGASLASAGEGDQSLGTLTLTTTSQLANLSDVTVEVTLISLGPTFSDRDRFEGEDMHLGIAVK